MVVGNFKYLDFVVKIEMLQWGRQWADICSSQVFQGVCEF